MKALDRKDTIIIILACVIIFMWMRRCSDTSDEKEVRDEEVLTDSMSNEEEFTVQEEPELKEKSSVRKVNKNNCFIIISKKLTRLNVYCTDGGDTILAKSYPVCLSKNKGQKQTKGDMKTPESPKGNPFTIRQIQDASGWHHDFGDGRGNILAYGHWFLRLETPGFSGIGIHGSTNNENTVPGRASEGCIRLNDKDIIDLKENYAFVGMKVSIQAEDDNPLPFEKKAQELGKAISLDFGNSANSEKLNDISEKTVPLNATIEVVSGGEDVNIRKGPDVTYPKLMKADGSPYHPKNGARLNCIGETSKFYNVIINGESVFISKYYSKIVKD